MGDYKIADVAQQHGISEEKVMEYSEAFQMFDKNSDGHITSKELADVMRALGQNPTKPYLDEIIQGIDSDGNGMIEFPEFCELMKTYTTSNPDPAGDLQGAFKVFDKNGDGFISAKELEVVMTSLGENLSKEEVKQMIKEVDIDKDGRVNYEEFTKMMMS